MQAGQLRHRVRFEVHGTAKDASGQVVDEWLPVITCWAAVEPLKGDERFDSAKQDPELSHRIRTRHTRLIKAKHRAVYDGRVFDVINVLDVGERRKQLHIMCTERQG